MKVMNESMYMYNQQQKERSTHYRSLFLIPKEKKEKTKSNKRQRAKTK